MPKKSVFVILMALAFALSACNFPLEFGDPEEVENAVAETLAAYEEKEVVVPTLPLLPTSTPVPTETPKAVVKATKGTAPTKEPCNSAMAWDLTVPDDTKFSGGEKIDKGWTLRNVGYCTWNSDYKIVFESGDKMNGPNEKKIGVEVAPNGEVEVVLTLAAPSAAGKYRGNWMLQTDDGDDIGKVWVQIIVE